MANTPQATVRVPPELEAAARRSHPGLAGLEVAHLLRAALAALAGHPVAEAVEITRSRPGPKREKTAA